MVLLWSDSHSRRKTNTDRTSSLCVFCVAAVIVSTSLLILLLSFVTVATYYALYGINLVVVNTVKSFNDSNSAGIANTVRSNVYSYCVRLLWCYTCSLTCNSAGNAIRVSIKKALIVLFAYDMLRNEGNLTTSSLRLINAELLFCFGWSRCVTNCSISLFWLNELLALLYFL